LTAAMVKAMETLVVDGGAEPTRRLLCGTALFLLFGRARVGDAARSRTEPFLDEEGSGDASFVEGAFHDHKTARPGCKRALPIVAPMVGVSGLPWGRAWVNLRQEAGLNASEAGTLLQAPGSVNTWSRASLRTCEFGNFLRGLLSGLGFAASSLACVGSHSLKVTCLSWSAKFGVNKEICRALGYHAAPGDKSVAAYDRSGMAGPLRDLVQVVRAVGDGSFNPDATRSGRFPAVPVASSSSSSSSSRSSSISASSGDSGDVPENALPFEAGVNLSTGMMHVLDGTKLKCGRALPLKWARVTEWPAHPRCCSKCF